MILNRLVKPVQKAAWVLILVATKFILVQLIGVSDSFAQFVLVWHKLK